MAPEDGGLVDVEDGAAEREAVLVGVVVLVVVALRLMVVEVVDMILVEVFAEEVGIPELLTPMTLELLVVVALLLPVSDVSPSTYDGADVP